MGPIGKATKVAPAMTPTALGRSALVNSVVRAEKAMTITPAPAKPMSALAAMNSGTEVEYAHATEPMPNSAMESRRIFLRP
jgi:hypothetical protein